MRELLLVATIVVAGIKCVQLYNDWEEPLASKVLRQSLVAAKNL